MNTRRNKTIVRSLGVVGASALALSLSACLNLDSGAFGTSELGCDSWTITPASYMLDGKLSAGSGLTFLAQVIDGNGNILYSETYDKWTVEDLTPIVGTFTAEPTANPIIAGFYYIYAGSGLIFPSNMTGQTLGGCASLPIPASVTPPPRLRLEKPPPMSFDVRFAEPITGFDIADVILGGTANPTGATLVEGPLVKWQQYYDYSFSSEPVQYAIDEASVIYRIAITGVENDGTVTVSFPANTVIGESGGTNLATNTATITIDTTSPSLGSLSDITQQLIPGQSSTTVSWGNPTASDLSGIAEQECIPASGSDFTAGNTLVTCSATDTFGNSSTTDFTVSILAAQTPVVHLARQDAAAPAQGGSSSFLVTATDYTGATAPLPADDYTVVSSVSTDEIAVADGTFTVTFPHASPHTLTVTQTSTGASAQLVVQVTPSAPAPAEVDLDAVTPGATLPHTGADAVVPAVLAAAALVIGLLLLIAARVRRRYRSVATSLLSSEQPS